MAYNIINIIIILLQMSRWRLTEVKWDFPEVTEPVSSRAGHFTLKIFYFVSLRKNTGKC